jgi:actin-related protein 10
MQSLGNNSRARRKDIPQEILDEDFLDEIKAKALLVMNAPPKQAQVETLSTADRFETQGYSDDTDEDHNVEWMKSLEARYRAECEVKDMVIAVPPKRRATMTPPSQPSTLGAGPKHHLQDRRGSIVIPGWIRAYAIEVLFEQGDNDSPSLTEVILDCLLRLPVDLRFIMARNIYLTGGTAMIAGLAHRLRLELVRTLNAAARFSEAGEPTLLSLHAPKVGFYASKGPSIDTKETQVGEEIARSTNDVSIADQSFVSAQGGNIDDESFATTYESADVAAKADKTNLSQSLLTRYTPIAGLVEHIAVVNDHAPRLAEDGLPLSGHAPSFPVNIVGWLGASLTGSLRIDAVDQMQREQWTEQQNRIKAATADADGSKADQRPSLGLGRGSFLGSVSGLDLGTYGPLSGGARNRFSPQAAASGAALRSPGSASSPRSPAA